AARWNTRKIDEHMKSLESPGNDFLCGFGVVGKPKSRSRAGRCLLSGLFGEDRCAIAALGEHDATRQARHACANDGDCSIHFQMVGTDRRAVRKILGFRPARRSHPAAMNVRAKSTGTV